ncbi:sensor histidine kinase [Nonomuraea angiospora]|uniref:sensor histidine kinase n=1 Tax=Nonomuraea angiospora TaxID=46172 RepID=UPI0029BEE057|nr:sensor histidine kinase [Nonomuraea angiospora]MDX3104100.1 sensor histidine kinase [Nonomuraea angiospora]
MIRRIRPGHWLALDRLAAIGYAFVAFLLLADEVGGPERFAVVPLGVIASALPIALRRQRPVVAFGIALAGLVAAELVERRTIILGMLSVAYVLYAVAVLCRPRTAFLALGMALAAAVATGIPGFPRIGGAPVISVLLFTTVWTVGYAVGMHRRHLGELLRNQARLAKQSVTDERMRIARELHDVIAHGMSVVTVQAGFGALVIDDRPQEARAALTAIETTGRQSLAEMRRLLGVLREEDRSEGPDLAPAPGLADLDRLLEQIAGAGVRVELTTTGPPRALLPGIDLSAYRIVQEALTNVVKHAATGSARVTLRYGPDELSIEVADDGLGCRKAGGPSPGHGLVGMRERAHLYGGAFHAAGLPEGGFRVTATLPIPSTEHPA